MNGVRAAKLLGLMVLAVAAIVLIFVCLGAGSWVL